MQRIRESLLTTGRGRIAWIYWGALASAAGIGSIIGLIAGKLAGFEMWESLYLGALGGVSLAAAWTLWTLVAVVVNAWMKWSKERKG